MRFKNLTLFAMLMLCWQVTTPLQAHLECEDGLEVMNKYSIFFGRNNIRNLEVVSDHQWNHFMEKFVTPFFPQGLTVYDVQGQWFNGTEVTKEGTKIVMILAKETRSKHVINNVKGVIEIYKTMFDKVLTVFLTQEKVCAASYKG